MRDPLCQATDEGFLPDAGLASKENNSNIDSLTACGLFAGTAGASGTARIHCGKNYIASRNA
jgi:hypothetical protein